MPNKTYANLKYSLQREENKLEISGTKGKITIYDGKHLAIESLDHEEKYYST